MKAEELAITRKQPSFQGSSDSPHEPGVVIPNVNSTEPLAQHLANTLGIVAGTRLKDGPVQRLHKFSGGRRQSRRAAVEQP